MCNLQLWVSPLYGELDYRKGIQRGVSQIEEGNGTLRTVRTRPFERTVTRDKPLAAIVLGMLAIPRAVVVDSIDAPIPQLLRQLPVPVDIGKGLAAAIRLPNTLDLDAKVVVSHGTRSRGEEHWRGERRSQLSRPSTTLCLLLFILLCACLSKDGDDAIA